MPKPRSINQGIQSQFDRLPSREGLFDKLKSGLASVAGFYGYEKVFTSVLEDPRFFQPIVKEELMLETPPIFCKTRDGEEVILKSSGALSALRAYFTKRMQDLPHPLKLLFDTQVFFSTRSILQRSGATDLAPVLGRSEYGLVMVGEEGPVAESQIVQILWKGIEASGVKVDSLAFRINATGCPECRSTFRSPFVSYLRNRYSRFCKNCKKHLKRLPTRVLSCGEEKCRIVANSSPQVLDFLCDTCKKHLTGFLEFLDEMEVSYFLDPKFFRDGSPFNLLIFELVKSPSSSSAVMSEKPGQAIESVSPAGAELKKELVFAEGGRLSRAGELMSGKKTEAVSGTVFLEALESLAGGLSVDVRRPKVFFAHLGELAKRKGMNIIEELRAAGIETQESLGRDSIKSQLKVAERMEMGIALLLGQKEALDGTIIVRETGLGVQETVPQEKLIEFLRKKLKK